ncbi:MAG: DUF4388 domain-containing protein [Bradymonadales bacterium]|nr:DUF4388 domain-containing protein [Bradymonadales bacterium]
MNPPEIILVESRPDLLAALLSLLQREGFAVHTASNLVHARQLVDEVPADLLLANLMLPDGSTFDLAEDWTGSGRAAVAITDLYHGSSVRQLLMRQSRFLEVLEIPVDERQLIDCLQGVFRQTYPSAVPPAAAVAVGEDVGPSWSIPPRLDYRAIPMMGNFEQFDIAAVLTRLAIDQVDGALMLQDGPIKKLLYFQQGTPIGIKSNLVQECLGQMLIREGRLNPRECDTSLDLMRTSNRRQGETLVTMGCLDASELSGALKRQFLLKYQQLFTWEKGIYRYREAATPPAYAGMPLDDPANLIWQAAQAVKPLKRVRAILQPLMETPVRWTHQGLPLSRLTIGEELLAVWSLIDGRRSPSDLTAASPQKTDTLLLLYALTALGALSYGLPT